MKALSEIMEGRVAGGRRNEERMVASVGGMDKCNGKERRGEVRRSK